jgi:hypothetical protein
LLDHVKDYKLGERLYMVCGGESGDVDAFATWAKANMDLYARRNGFYLFSQKDQQNSRFRLRNAPQSGPPLAAQMHGRKSA